MRKNLAVVATGAMLALMAGFGPAAAAAAAVPWGAGCTTDPPGAQRTSASCGASLANGHAIAPPQPRRP
jgi:hypothetical protein